MYPKHFDHSFEWCLKSDVEMTLKPYNCQNLIKWTLKHFPSEVQSHHSGITLLKTSNRLGGVDKNQNRSTPVNQ